MQQQSNNTFQMQRPAIFIIILSIAARLLWELDANLSLFIYDAYITRGSTVHNQRRAFPPGSTKLDGKTIWITGGSSGIGAELALQLATSGGVGHLILSGRKVEKLEAVAKSAREASKAVNGSYTIQISMVPFNMKGGPNVLEGAVSSALEKAGPSGIDILILNAGQYQCRPALDTNVDEALPNLMQINFAAPVQLSQKLMQLDNWKERKYGHIVTVSSLMGRGPSPLNAIYSASKHALRGYFHSLAAEESSWLRVDVVLPGATDTGLWSGSYDAKESNSKLGALHADDRSKMAVQRCARLIVSSILGSNFLFFETWITNNPGLIWVYLASYTPSILHHLVVDYSTEAEVRVCEFDCTL